MYVVVGYNGYCLTILEPMCPRPTKPREDEAEEEPMFLLEIARGQMRREPWADGVSRRRRMCMS
jgi:hypothetical protein